MQDVFFFKSYHDTFNKLFECLSCINFECKGKLCVFVGGYHPAGAGPGSALSPVLFHQQHYAKALPSATHHRSPSMYQHCDICQHFLSFFCFLSSYLSFITFTNQNNFSSLIFASPKWGNEKKRNKEIWSEQEFPL